MVWVGLRVGDLEEGGVANLGREGCRGGIKGEEGWEWGDELVG